MASISDLAGQLRSGATTSAALTETALAQAGLDTFGAFATVTADVARAGAAAADRERRAGRDRGPLHGIPVAVKDVIDVAGVLTGNGAPGYADRVPAAPAAVWQALSDAGAVLIGKTRLSALALELRTPGCVNPCDPTRTCGGSSGGSAAAVAAGIVPLALGTDTTGSVRIPAALTGTVGLRPTHRALPQDGVSPVSPSQDTVGVIATTPGDCLLALEVMRRGAARRGPGPAIRPGSPRLGLPDLWRDAVDADTAATLGALHEKLAARYDVHDCRPDRAGLAPAVSYILTMFEAARLWPAGAGLPPSVRNRLAFGAAIPEAEYAEARSLAGRIGSAVTAVFAHQADVLVLPTTAVTAVPSGTDLAWCGGNRAVPVATAYGRFTALASVTGLPAITVPCGADRAGLPIGVQLIGPPHTEPVLCALAAEIVALTEC